MRLMAGQWLNGRVEHRLDWFHLSRRIQWLGRSIYWAIDYDEPAYEERLARYRRNLRSVRWNVCHYGKSRHARWMIALSRLGAQLLSHRNKIDAARGDLSKIEAACKRFDELEAYLYSNIGSLTDYGRAWRQGERIATAKHRIHGEPIDQSAHVQEAPDAMVSVRRSADAPCATCSSQWRPRTLLRAAAAS